MRIKPFWIGVALALLMIPGVLAVTINITNPANQSTISPFLSSTWINITTNETADCVYSTSSSFDFADGTAFTNTGSTIHSFNYTDLSSGSTYTLYYMCNNSESENSTATHAFSSDAGSYIISGIEVNRTNESANISCSSTRNGTVTLRYGTTSGSYTYNTTNSTTGNHHLFTITGLSENTRYYYRLNGTDIYSVTNQTSQSYFTTTDLTSPTISSLSNTSRDHNISFSWVTNEQSTCRIYYGTTTSYGSTSVSDTSASLVHTDTIIRLTANTLYYFKINCTDTSSNKGYSTFSVRTQNDTTAPSPSLLYPTNNVKDDDATVIIGTTELAKCKYSTEDKNYSSMDHTITSTAAYNHTFTLSNMENDRYDYYCRCIDTTGNVMTSSYEFEITIAKEVIEESSFQGALNGTTATSYSVKDQTRTYAIYDSEAGAEETVNIDDTSFIISKIYFTPLYNYSTIRIKVTRIFDSTRLLDFEHMLYAIQKIEQLEPSEHLDFNVDFGVSRSWLLTNQVEKDLVRVFAYNNGQWIKLSPKIGGIDGYYQYYTLKNYHYDSYFVVGVDKDDIFKKRLASVTGETEDITTTTTTVKNQSNATSTTGTTTTSVKPPVTFPSQDIGEDVNPENTQIFSEPADPELLEDPEQIPEDKKLQILSVLLLATSIIIIMSIAWTHRNDPDIREMISRINSSLHVNIRIPEKKKSGKDNPENVIEDFWQEYEAQKKSEIEEKAKEKIKEQSDINEFKKTREKIMEESLSLKKDIKTQKEEKIKEKMEEEGKRIDNMKEVIIEKFVRDSISKGHNKEAVIKVLKKKGISTYDINRIMEKIEKLKRYNEHTDKAFLSFASIIAERMKIRGKSDNDIISMLTGTGHINSEEASKILNSINDKLGESI